MKKILKLEIVSKVPWMTEEIFAFISKSLILMPN